MRPSLPCDSSSILDVQGAMVSIEPQSGDVVAMVGGYSFGSSGSQFNRVTQAQRQPGSSVEPIVYSAALDDGFTPASMLLDAPIILIDKWTKKAWRPGNDDGKFNGPMPLFRALARSRNLCTVRVAQQMGVEHIIARAKALRLRARVPGHPVHQPGRRGRVSAQSGAGLHRLRRRRQGQLAALHHQHSGPLGQHHL